MAKRRRGRKDRTWMSVVLALAMIFSGGASPAAAAEGEALSAEFVDVPAAHDGGEFTLGLRFSPEPQISYRVFSTGALSIEGGMLARAQRVERGHNDRWSLRVAPR